jgi:hypothetical protein
VVNKNSDCDNLDHPSSRNCRYRAWAGSLRTELYIASFESDFDRRSTAAYMGATYAGKAEQCFRRAIATAAGQGAKSWGLRATMSDARLLDKRGRREVARAMLAEIYGWFTEGFDPADLKDTKALLDELSR